MKSKVESTSGGFGMQGGKSNHMLTGMTAGPQTPGQTAQEGKSSAKYASGGSSNHMFGKQIAGTQMPGGTAHDVSGKDEKYVCGGKGPNNHMFGKQSAKPATPA